MTRPGSICHDTTLHPRQNTRSANSAEFRVFLPDIPGIGDWQPLARGGFATVWRARQLTLDRPVAVKVDDRTLDTEAERRRFLGEAKAAGNLSGHPGIVTVHDAGFLPTDVPIDHEVVLGWFADQLAAGGQQEEP